MEALILHHLHAPPAALSALSAADFAAMQWHAREVPHRLRTVSASPRWFANLRVPQEQLNSHLLTAYGFLLSAWAPFWRSHTDAANAEFILGQAAAQLSEAQRRDASLRKGRQRLRRFSLRQFRLLQCLAHMADTLVPDGTVCHPNTPVTIEALHALHWHAAQLRTAFAPQRPNLRQRIAIDLRLNNHYLAMSVLLSIDFLQLEPQKAPSCVS